MATSPSLPRLITGQRMEREEFIRVWNQIPELKNAELIDGEVWVASPVGRGHCDYDGMVQFWLGYYAAATPGLRLSTNGSWLMLESMPQPDAALHILPQHGGQSAEGVMYHEGAPELAVEICDTNTTYDFGPKLALYQRARVCEYITFELIWKRITWRVLDQGSYREITPRADGTLCSVTFPGLWLNSKAFQSLDGQGVLATLNEGLASQAHADFALDLAARRR